MNMTKARSTQLAVLGTFLMNLASPDIQAQQPEGDRLIAAVMEGDAAQTRTLLVQWNKSGKPWPTGPDAKPLLFLAIEGREAAHSEIIDLLLASGAKIETRGPDGMTALHWATANGYPERTEQILKSRPQIEAKDERGRTPLLVAHGEAAEKLLAAGANVLATDKDGLTALHYAAQNGGKHLDVLFNAGFTVIDGRSNAGLTPLHIAAAEGSESAARWLLENGADVNATVASEYDYLPGGMAPGYGHELRLSRGHTPLQIASRQHKQSKWSSGRHRTVLDLLKAKGVKGSKSAAFPADKYGILAATSALAIIPFAVAFFTGLLLLDARLTGWHTLAQRFAASAEPANVRRNQNGGVGAVSLIQLRGLLRAAADEHGLYFAFPKFLSAGHAPLRIPWSELKLRSDRTLLGVRVLELQAGEPKIAGLYLRGGVADAVAARLEKS